MDGRPGTHQPTEGERDCVGLVRPGTRPVQPAGARGGSAKGPARLEQNRSTVLRNLGQFEPSIQASQAALEILTRSARRLHPHPRPVGDDLDRASLVGAVEHYIFQPL